MLSPRAKQLTFSACVKSIHVQFPPSLQLLSLTLDGLTGVSQDHMRAHYQTGSNHMMLNVNLWSTLFLGAGKDFVCSTKEGDARWTGQNSAILAPAATGAVEGCAHAAVHPWPSACSLGAVRILLNIMS